MNPRSIRIAGHMVLTSWTLYVTDVLVCTNNSVAGAMLLSLGTIPTGLQTVTNISKAIPNICSSIKEHLIPNIK
jgi:hypothetical protein